MSVKTTIIRGLIALERPDADEIADEIMDGVLLVGYRDEHPDETVRDFHPAARQAAAYAASAVAQGVVSVQEAEPAPEPQQPPAPQPQQAPAAPAAPAAPPASSGKKRRSLDEIVSDTAAEYDVEFTLDDVREWAHPNKVTAKLIEGYAQGLQSAKVEQAVAVPTQPGDPFVAAAPVQQEAPAPQLPAQAPFAAAPDQAREPAPQQPQLQPPAPAPFPGELPEGIAVYQPGPQAPWEM